jgi:hypothetical protein
LHPANFAPSQQSAVRYIATVSATALFLHQESKCPGDERRRRGGKSPVSKQHPEHPTAQRYLTRSAQGLKIPYCTKRSDRISHHLRSEEVLQPHGSDLPSAQMSVAETQQSPYRAPTSRRLPQLDSPTTLFKARNDIPMSFRAARPNAETHCILRSTCMTRSGSVRPAFAKQSLKHLLAKRPETT